VVEHQEDNRQIAVTSYGLGRDEGKVLAAGYDAYISTPYNPRQLLTKAVNI